ncbi:hypothetical protein ACH492_32810 [Streptomyces sp. NPDC019443]|uniref:hypothetical protein n=1 Tax=Streptomyces sp. NPDC019443 TaxID=3365061 RepID=UPI00378AACA1
MDGQPPREAAARRRVRRAYAMFACWIAVALAVYVLYSRHHSRLQAQMAKDAGEPESATLTP